jgi:hypothetical protein
MDDQYYMSEELRNAILKRLNEEAAKLEQRLLGEYMRGIGVEEPKGILHCMDESSELTEIAIAHLTSQGFHPIPMKQLQAINHRREGGPVVHNGLQQFTEEGDIQAHHTRSTWRVIDGGCKHE